MLRASCRSPLRSHQLSPTARPSFATPPRCTSYHEPGHQTPPTPCAPAGVLTVEIWNRSTPTAC